MVRDAFRAFDRLGNIALVKFSDNVKLKDKKIFANKILRDNLSVKTILEKTGKFSGRLRKQKTNYIAGEKTKEVLYRENRCVFRFNIDSTYFSPRLSNERLEIAKKVKKNDEVLIMFAGVSPYGIVIGKHSKAKKIYSVEINREASKYAKLNVELNKLEGRVEVVQSDVKKFVSKLFSAPPRNPAARPNELKNQEIPSKFDVIVMPRPQLKDSFLPEAFRLSKKGTRIFYYDFTPVSEKENIVEKIKEEAKKAKKKIKILNVKNAGEVAPYKVRLRVDFKVI